MKVYITEYDKDYHTVTNTLKKEFETLEQAEAWCEKESWSGYTYWIDRELTKAVNE